MPKAIKSAAKMKWQKAPEELVQLFEQTMQSFPEAETRKMFGYPAAFVNGQMVGGLYQDKLMLRLSETDRAALFKIKGAAPFEPMPGRPMREYVVVPPSVLKSKVRLRSWLEKALTYTASLPPKTKSRRPR